MLQEPSLVWEFVLPTGQHVLAAIAPSATSGRFRGLRAFRGRGGVGLGFRV